VFAQGPSPIKPASIYHQGSVTVVSPNQPGWLLLQASKSETVFARRAADKIASASVKTIKTKVFENERDLLIGLEALKQEELNKLKRDSLHFNYVRFKGSPCVQYDGIFKVEGAAAHRFEYFNFKGYLCRHPESKDSAVQIEFSNYSNIRGFSETFLSLSDEFFEKTGFSSR
jgi:hypothetical protein